MDNRLTNSDKLLQMILSEDSLIDYGEYDSALFSTLEAALSSDNVVVVAVAKIINGLQEELSENTIYTEVKNHLEKNIQ